MSADQRRKGAKVGDSDNYYKLQFSFQQLKNYA